MLQQTGGMAMNAPKDTLIVKKKKVVKPPVAAPSVAGRVTVNRSEPNPLV